MKHTIEWAVLISLTGWPLVLAILIRDWLRR